MEERGLIANRRQLVQRLQEVGYYRLSEGEYADFIQHCTEQYERSREPFGLLTILSYLLERVAPNTSWRMQLFRLLETRTEDELKRMGFTEGWKECPLWKPWVDMYLQANPDLAAH